MPGVVILEEAPSVDVFIALREAVGWGTADREAASRSVVNSLYWIILKDEDKERVIGCGRVIGDQGLCYYVQDLIVLPEYQGRGYGRQMMEKIMSYLDSRAATGAIAGLMAAINVENFYLPYGFEKRPNLRMGPGMIRYLADPFEETREKRK
jgi:GNAT superfamily N-acetyltransferase